MRIPNQSSENGKRGKKLLLGTFGKRESNLDNMVLFSFWVHLFGNNREDDGEAVAAGDGEVLLVVVRAEEHVVADGI